MRLYHFTALIHLPRILREGITRGEVPVSPNTPVTQLCAPNLTTNPNPVDQHWCFGCPINKTKIRLTVDVADEKLTSFRQVKEKYKMKASWIKILDCSYERRHWYFAFGGVPVEQITKIEMLDNGAYRELAPEELRELVARIEEERNTKFTFVAVTSGRRAGHIAPRFKDGHHESWLCDGQIA